MRPLNLLTRARVEAAVLALGVLLRVADFLLVRSLWLDEAMLARNVIDRSPADLIKPLDHDQAAPIAFLVAQKLVISVFGTAEWAFRLLPCLLGIWALFLFARLSRQLVGPRAALCVLPLFAFNPYLAGATNKQYPVDVWAVLFLAGLVWRVADPAARRRDYAVLAAVGACLVWVAHPVPLVAAGLGTAVIVGHARAGRWREAGLMVSTAGCWLASFAALYLLAVRHIHSNDYLVAYWQLGFPPVGRGVAGFASWAGRVLTDAFIIPGRVSPVQLGLALAVVGAARLVRDPVRFGFVALPVAVVFGAAVARVFPFQHRLLLFLVPFFVWLVAAGLDGLVEARWRAVRLAGWACVAALVWPTILELKGGLLKPARYEESREVLAYVISRAEPGDVLYVHPNARHTFEYYRGRLDLAGLEVVHGPVVPPAEAARRFGELPAARRVWVFHSEMRNGANFVVPLTWAELLAVAAAGRPALDRRDAPGVFVALFGPARPVGE